MFRRRFVTSLVARWYATEAEYTSGIADPASQAVLQGKDSFVIHFMSKTHPSLQEHNAAVKEAMAAINKGDVQMKCIEADVSENPQMSMGMMRVLNVPQAPAVVAVSQGQMLDVISGITEKSALEAFMTKFLQYTGKPSPFDSSNGEAEPAAEDEGDIMTDTSSSARLARLIVQTKQGRLQLTPQENIQQLTDIIAAAKEEVEAERKASTPDVKKSSEKPSATISQEAWAHAQVMLADAHQQLGDNAEAAKQMAAVKKQFSRFDLAAVNNAGNLVEMNVVVEFDHRPAEDYGVQLAQKPDDAALQLRLSVALFHEGSAKEAVALALQVLRKHRNFNDGAAKRVLMAQFTILGPSSDITLEGRKKMLAYLF
ncbi:putative thioredoxin-2 [Diplonema papillatum]|nr:putative thioredoxin-2 [Diplonema papillatum]